MSDYDDDGKSRSIASAFSDCLTLYRRLWFSLTDHEFQVADQVDLAKLSDGYGRLNVWGSDSGALRTGRGSLDDVLRTDDKLRSIVVDIIDDLINALKQGRFSSPSLISELHNAMTLNTYLAILLSKRNENISQHNNSTRDDSDEDSLSSISTISEQYSDDGIKSRPKKSETQHLVSHIFGQIRSLYKMSILLRRPAVHDKYMRSVSKDANTSYFLPWDHAHVENKFRNARQVFVRRLALANTRRRQQLQYWEKHHENEAEGMSPASHPHPTVLKIGVAKPNSNARPQEKPPVIGSASEKIPAQSLGMSFSTVAQSAVNDNETFSGRPRTIYAPSFQGRGRRLRIPDLPTVPFGRTSFECPYCYAQLDVQTMRQRELWK